MDKRTRPRRYRSAWVGMVLGAVALAVVGTATPGFAVAVTVTLSAYSGPSAGGNTVTATSTTAVFGAGNAVEFQYVGTSTAATCSATYATPVAVAATAGVQSAGIIAVPSNTTFVLSSTKLAFTVPSGVVLGSGQTSAKYNVCIYAGTVVGTSALIANNVTTTPYTIAAKPTITSMSPASGSSQGGNTITVVGTNFPTAAGALTATLGGAALTNISVASNGTSFTATTPPHTAGGPVLLSVTTSGGTVSTLGTGTTKALLFTYTNGITITPNTAPNTNPGAVIDVLGVGFSSLYFSTTTGATPDDTNSHVYLVSGAYSPANNAGAKTNGEVNECTVVLVVSDTELLCTLNLTQSYSAGALAAASSRTLSDAVVTSGSTTVTSATGNFTAADVNMAVTGTGIAAGTTIASVTNATTAVLSAAATGNGTGISIGPRTIADAATTSASTAMTSSTAAFTTSDVGRLVTGTGIPANTYITSVTNATTVVLSQAATATGTGVSVTESIAAPTRVGTYTLTVVSNGGIDVQPGGANADPNYTQSVISSGSTFTVAGY